MQDPVIAGESQVLSIAESKATHGFSMLRLRGHLTEGMTWDCCLPGRAVPVDAPLISVVFANGEFYYAFKTKISSYQGMLILAKNPPKHT